MQCNRARQWVRARIRTQPHQHGNTVMCPTPIEMAVLDQNAPSEEQRILTSTCRHAVAVANISENTHTHTHLAYWRIESIGRGRERENEWKNRQESNEEHKMAYLNISGSLDWCRKGSKAERLVHNYTTNRRHDKTVSSQNETLLRHQAVYSVCRV